MLTEIEHKVASLLDTCKDQSLGDCGATQQEAEALSWKLKTVKCNLEKVQMMLQEKHSEDQVSMELRGHPRACRQYSGWRWQCRDTIHIKESQDVLKGAKREDARASGIALSFHCAGFQA